MAIDFPNSPTVNDTHTSAGVTWKWDGTTWKAEGVTSSYTLPTASSTVLGGVKVGTNLSINASGVLSASGGEITVQEEGSSLSTAATTLNFVGSNVTATGTGAVKTITISDSDTQLTTEQVQDIVGAMFSGNTETNITATYEDSDGTIDLVASGGSGLDTRSTFTATTTSLANNAADINVQVTAHKSYMLLKIKPSIAAWVVLYVDAASRTADASRVQGADPAPDAGVIAEVVTTAANQEIKMSPGVLGWHQDPGNDAVDTVFCKVTNRSGSTSTCTVALTVVQLEA